MVMDLPKSPFILNNQARTDIYFGGQTIAGTPDIPLETPLTEINSTPGSGNVGDLNGDGYEDLVLVVTPGLDGAQVLLGGADPQPTLSAPIPLGASCGYTTIVVAGGGDINRDGFEDFFVSCPNVGIMGVRREHADRAVECGPQRSCRDHVSGQFDLDRDGLSDLLVASSAAGPQLFRGSEAFDLQAAEAEALSSLSASDQVAIADHNGDGFWDIVIGGYETALRRANGDGSFDPIARGSFVDDTNNSIEDRIVY